MALVGKEQLVREIAERSGLGVEKSRRALDGMLKAIETELGNGNEVRLTGFGKFSVSRREARQGRNPQTGESMRIAAKKVPHFSAGAELKKAVPETPQKPESEAGSESRGSLSGKEGSQGKEEVSNPAHEEKTISDDRWAEETGHQPGDTTDVEPEKTAQSQRKRATGTRNGSTTSRKPTSKGGGAAPGPTGGPAGGDEGKHAGADGPAEAMSVAPSRAKVALVVVAGLAAGAAGALVVTRD